MTILASIGVGILMAAFLANLAGRLESSSVAYQGMNAVGAGIAAFASYGIGFMPFVVLEGTWCVAALASLFRTATLRRELTCRELSASRASLPPNRLCHHRLDRLGENLTDLVGF